MDDMIADALLACLGHGQASAKKTKQLTEDMRAWAQRNRMDLHLDNDGRVIQQALEECKGVLSDGTTSWAVAGHPSHGYFKIKTREEYDDEVRRLSSRALKVLGRRSSIKRWHRRWPTEHQAPEPVPEGFQFALV